MSFSPTASILGETDQADAVPQRVSYGLGWEIPAPDPSIEEAGS